jgi:hypothetical protein
VTIEWLYGQKGLETVFITIYENQKDQRPASSNRGKMKKPSGEGAAIAPPPITPRAGLSGLCPISIHAPTSALSPTSKHVLFFPRQQPLKDMELIERELNEKRDNYYLNMQHA